ncbi:MAG: cytochrome c [Pirellulales bacterium]
MLWSITKRTVIYLSGIKISLLVIIFALVSFILSSHSLQAQDTPDYFRQNCMNCHTIGDGRLTGSDLKGVTERKDREWLSKFMANPKSVIDSGDPYAQKLLEESRNVPMPTLPGLTKERLKNLLDLIESESKLEESQFKGLKISNKPFTDEDRALGRSLFMGTTKLKAGGTACISCHNMHDTPSLGGGWLGPDLTNIYERLEGRKSLSAWLMAPGTETMLPIFKDHPMDADEINSLAAYFESSAGKSPADPSANRIAFLLMGLLGAAATNFGFDAIWKKRFHSVRRPLVDTTPTRGHE